MKLNLKILKNKIKKRNKGHSFITCEITLIHITEIINHLAVQCLMRIIEKKESQEIKRIQSLPENQTLKIARQEESN
jgi:hypothetical protein